MCCDVYAQEGNMYVYLIPVDDKKCFQLPLILFSLSLGLATDVNRFPKIYYKKYSMYKRN